MNAIDAAKQVAALIPAKPRGRLFGVNRRDQAAAEHYHAAMMADVNLFLVGDDGFALRIA